MDPSDRKVRCLSRYLNQPIANLRIKFFVWYRAISQFQFSSFAFYTVKKKKEMKGTRSVSEHLNSNENYTRFEFN